MSRRKRKNKELHTSARASVKPAKFIFRFFLLAITTIVVVIISLFFFAFITIKGPSAHARDIFINYAYRSDYISFVPGIFLTPDEINDALSKGDVEY